MWNSTIVYSMFANTIFAPQGDHMEIFRMFPVDGRLDRAVMETSLYIPKPVENEDEKRHWDANLALAVKVMTTEDFPAGRTMQIGFNSGAQTHIVYGRNEPALAHYHKSIRRELGLPVDEVPRPCARRRSRGMPREDAAREMRLHHRANRISRQTDRVRRGVGASARISPSALSSAQSGIGDVASHPGEVEAHFLGRDRPRNHRDDACDARAGTAGPPRRAARRGAGRRRQCARPCR